MTTKQQEYRQSSCGAGLSESVGIVANTHTKREVYTSAKRFTASARRNLHLHKEVYIYTKRFTSRGRGVHVRHDVYIYTKSFTPTRRGLHNTKREEVYTYTKRFTLHEELYIYTKRFTLHEEVYTYTERFTLRRRGLHLHEEVDDDNDNIGDLNSAQIPYKMGAQRGLE